MTVSLLLDIDKITPSDNGKIILQDIKIEMDKPGLIWIQGLNGSGKSILASVFSGKAFIKNSGLSVKAYLKLRTSDGKTIVITHNRHQLREYIENVSLLPQKLGSSTLALHHQDDICFPFEGDFPDFPGRTNKEKDKIAIARIETLNNKLKLWTHLTKGLGQSSYGETRRMEFACSLSGFRSIIVLDEPFSGIDKDYQKTIIELIHEFSDNSSIWIITSHEPPNRFDLKPDIIRHLNLPPIKKHVFRNISEIIQNRFAKNPIDVQKNVGINNLQIERKKPQESRVELPYFIAEPKSLTWLEGLNGSGKSSIVQNLAGLLTSSKILKISVCGKVEGDAGKAPNDYVRLLLQDPYKSFIYRTVKEDILSPNLPMEIREKNKLDFSRAFWKNLEINWGNLNRKPSTFSFGQLRFLQLLLIPFTAEVVIFDEPLLGIHPSLHSTILSALISIADSGRIVIATSQIGIIDQDQNIVFTITKN